MGKYQRALDILNESFTASTSLEEILLEAIRDGKLNGDELLGVSMEAMVTVRELLVFFRQQKGVVWNDLLYARMHSHLVLNEDVEDA